MDAAKIKHVSIEKLWGMKNISTDFDSNVNIFIGSNGSSKTTFLNLIEAVLVCDINTFMNIDFECIYIEFQSEVVDFVRVQRCYTEDAPIIKYTFNNNEVYEIICSEMLLRPYNRTKQKDIYLNLKEKLSNITSISWLSINRDNLSFSEIERVREYMDRIKNMVDLKIQELVKKLLVYQLQLESEANKDAIKFKEEVLSLMLYNETFDNYNAEKMKSFESTDIESMKRDLYKAFNKLGVAKDKNELIQNHINKIKEVISRISNNSSTILFEDVFVLSLINRTLSIIEISKEHEIITANIFAPMFRLWKCLQGFMPSKNFHLNNYGKGELLIELKENNKELQHINVTSLSSGEKQLFILLAEALLQKKASHLFIADEPELSLHIEWQRNILNALLDLNPNAQIIVATHSPEIAGSFPNKIINMRNITYYE